MSNLRLYGGRVPVQTGDNTTPIKLVDFPSFDEFKALYHGLIKAENIPRYYRLLSARAGGSTLTDAAKAEGISKERARQIEARFLRMMQRSLA